MKIYFRTQFILIILTSLLMGSVCSASADLRSEVLENSGLLMPTIKRDITGAFPFVIRGRVVALRSVPLMSTLATIYYYFPEGEESAPIALTGSVTSLEQFVQDQFRDGNSDVLVNDKQPQSRSGLLHLLQLMFAGDNTWLLTSEFRQEMRNVFLESVKNEGLELLDKIPDPDIIVNAGGWRAQFAVVDNQGAIIEYLFEGKSNPFKIVSVNQKVVFPTGTVNR